MAVDDKLTPRLIRVFTIVLLQRYFSSHPQYPWNRDQALSSLFIQEDFAEDSKYEDIVPAIIVESNGSRFSEDGIGNTQELTSTNVYQARKGSLLTINGNLTLHCIAESSVEAEELAWEISVLLVAARDYAKDLFHMQYMGMPTIGKPGTIKKKGWSSTYDCPVNVDYSFAIKLHINPIDNGELLKSIEFYLESTSKNGIRKGDSINNPIHNNPNHDGSSDDGSGPSDKPPIPVDPNKPYDPRDPYKNFSEWIYLKFKVTNDSVEGTQSKLP